MLVAPTNEGKNGIAAAPCQLLFWSLSDIRSNKKNKLQVVWWLYPEAVSLGSQLGY